MKKILLVALLAFGFATVLTFNPQKAMACSGPNCKYNEPQDPLASPRTSADPVQECAGNNCAKPSKPSAFSLMPADCNSVNCKYSEPKDPLAPAANGGRTSPDAVRECTGPNC
jgi:hypothetical protein